MDAVVPGGVARDFAPSCAATVAALLEDVRRLFPQLVELDDNTAWLQDRTATTGILRSELARQFGAGGYVGRASGFDTRKMLPYPENSLDFMSAKVQSEEDRNANAKRSGFPFQNLIDGTRSSVPRRSLRRRSGQWNSRERPSRVGGRYGDCNRKSDAGCGTPSRCRYMPVTRIPANSDQNRRAEYLKA
jgi:Respiratory-chain NADH dehydrogenase, 49 Kd subunit